MNITTQDRSSIIRSATILGTGGGGRLDTAQKLLSQIKDNLTVTAIADLPSVGRVVTVYGVGGLTKPGVDRPAIRKRCQQLLTERLSEPIVGVIPVEIGPSSVAQAMVLASALGVPLVDGDLAGRRAVPEIFIELVTLANLDRCPLVVANNDGDFMTLERLSTPEKIETVARAFAMASTSNALVVGYPLRKADLERAAAPGSVSYCLELATTMSPDFSLVAKGVVTADYKQEMQGFTRGSLTVKSNQVTYGIEYKNEYLVLTKDKETLLTCPDLIMVVDQKTGLGLNNGEYNVGKRVAIYVTPAVAQWRTAAGLRLFSPRRLGLPYDQKILGV